jgi:integrase
MSARHFEQGTRPSLTRTNRASAAIWTQPSLGQPALRLPKFKSAAAARTRTGSRTQLQSGTTSITGRELHELRRHQWESPQSPFVFVSERGAPLSRPGFARMVERASKLKIKAHAHMLRHACGFKLAKAGVDTRALQAYLGHCNIQHTVRYTELAPDRFKDFWRD